MNTPLSEAMARERLTAGGLADTPHRVQVLMAIGSACSPSSAQEILEHVRAHTQINRVTVYRILDLLVEHNVVNRLSLGEKSQRFCLRDAERAKDHAHFHCTRCGRFLCVPSALPVDSSSFDGQKLIIDHIDLRLEGICPACQKTEKKN